jgi:hypothetical protein
MVEPLMESSGGAGRLAGTAYGREWGRGSPPGDCGGRGRGARHRALLAGRVLRRRPLSRWV